MESSSDRQSSKDATAADSHHVSNLSLTLANRIFDCDCLTKVELVTAFH